ncbi:NLPA lipoprotein [Pseudomonas mandelii JR-1]|uniref:NLPA lipoprotein n=1 Tax=Pseudomonas mandelii JR-1 TaxID=1147786 RepID=A0A024EC09_9PSED|nr:NLPA lipoprotein [Pseudomonas mandelii JR-1]
MGEAGLFHDGVSSQCINFGCLGGPLRGQASLLQVQRRTGHL